MSKALVAFPKRAIEDVSKIHFKNKNEFLSRKNAKPNEAELFNYMFEVYLREDYEDIYMYRDEERKVENELRSKTNSRSASPRRDNSFTGVGEERRKQSISKEMSYSTANLRDFQFIDLRIQKKELSDYDKLVMKNKKEFR